MNKKQGVLIGIALVLLFTGIALATSSASSNVEIYAFDQNPAGSDKGNEWITLYNPSNESVDIGNWTLENEDGEKETIPEGTTLYPFAYYVYTPPYQWLDNSDEVITLTDSKGEEIDKTPVVNDNENDNRYWMHNNSEWIFGVKEFEKGKIWNGVVKNMVDGDTIDVSFDIYGIQRIRLVGVNTLEIGGKGYEEAKEFVKDSCLGEGIKLDVDDKKQHDRYYRILAVVYVNETNLNERLVREGYAEIMYIPPSEFNPYEWNTPTLSQTPTPIPNGEIGVTNRMDIIEVLLTVCLTVAGAAVIAFTNFWLEGRRRRENFFKALYIEIKHNRLITQKLLKIKRDISVSPTELPIFYTSSYQNIRITDELFILRDELRMELEEVYELIRVHTLYGSLVADPDVRKNLHIYKRLGHISKKLKHLENELPKIKKIKFLNHGLITTRNN